MPAELLIYALVAAGLVFWLRSILGTRHGDERERPNPFTQSARDAHMKEKADRAAAKSAGGGSPLPIPGVLPGAAEAAEPLERNMAVHPVAHMGLEEIARIDRSFTPAHFLRGAQDAFVMIVEAFSAGDKETLRGLLDPVTFTPFARAIENREREGQKAHVEIHAIRRAEIVNAKVERKTAYVTVKFTADETNVLFDRDGKPLEGHPDRVSETIDVWTFMRDLRARTPEWFLVETRDDDAAQQDHKTVPNSRGS